MIEGKGISKERATGCETRTEGTEGAGMGGGGAFNLTGSHLPCRRLVSSGRAIKTSAAVTLQAPALLCQALDRQLHPYLSWAPPI